MKPILRWLIRLCLMVVLLLNALNCHARESNTPHPNIVVILCDDLGFETVACYGGTSYKTPNVDALAKSGILFKNAYCTPLCSPSRVELMTGRYGFRTSWINLIGRGDDANDYFDPKKEITFGRVLKQAGYATAIAGKWQLCDFPQHPNHLQECGFDESCMWTWQLRGKRTSRYWNPSIWQNGKLLKDTDGKFGDDLFSDFLINFMSRHKEQPFFVYYPMALVHEPHVPTPDSPTADHARPNADDQDKVRGDRKLKEKRAARLFPGMMSYMDKTVGKMVAAIDKLGLRENTLIIFTGDNGTDRSVVSKLGNMTVRGGKGTMTEFGTHVPFIVSWKGVTAPGQIKEELVDFSDVLPTVAEIGAAKLPGDRVIDGHSFAALLRSEKGSSREWIFSQLGHDRLARTGKFMLHDNGKIFDVVSDPFEEKNLAGRSDPDVVAAKQNLKAVLDKLK